MAAGSRVWPRTRSGGSLCSSWRREFPTVEACRRVEVDRRTGYGWRRPAAHDAKRIARRLRQWAATAAAAPREVSRHYLSLAERAAYLSPAERIVIADRLREGAGQTQIADELGRPQCTISREFHRNTRPDSVGYQPCAAQHSAEARDPCPQAKASDPCPQAKASDPCPQAKASRWPCATSSPPPTGMPVHFCDPHSP